MKTITALFFASSLLVGAPLAMADDLVISPEIGIHFHDNVKVKKYKSHKYDGDLKVGVVVPGDVEYYDVPDVVIVATPGFQEPQVCVSERPHLCRRQRSQYLGDHRLRQSWPATRKKVVGRVRHGCSA
jgi:hypothetical protein